MHDWSARRTIHGDSSFEPRVGLLALISVVDLLLEKAVIVVDAVAVSGHPERGQRLEEAGRQPSEAAVAQRGVGLGGDQLVEVPRP